MAPTEAQTKEVSLSSNVIFNDDIVFIHIGKTGGMSCASYLLSCLKGPIYNCHAGAAKDVKQTNEQVIAVTDINRHCTLRAAEEHIQRLTGSSAFDRAKVLAVIRNPHTLEYSFYRHLQKPQVIQQRKKNDQALLQLAQGDFKTFAKEAGYHRPGLKQEDYFLIDGEIPANLEIIRYENLTKAFTHAVAPFARPEAGASFPHMNSSGSDEQLTTLLDDELRNIIYRKHQYIFDHYYQRERPADADSTG